MGFAEERREWFLQKAAEFASDWGSLDLRLVAERGRKGDWVPIHLRCTFSSAAVDGPLHPDLPRTTEVLAIHARLPTKDLRRIVEGVSAAKLEVAGHEFSFRKDGHADPLPSLYPRSLDVAAAKSWLGIDGAAMLFHTSDSVNMRLNDPDQRTADASLQTLSHPWEGIDDVRRNFIGAAGGTRNYDYANYEFIVPIGTRLESLPSFDGHLLRFTMIVAPGLDLSKTRLACIAHYAEGPPSRGQIEFNRNPDAPEIVHGAIEFKRPPRYVNLSLTHRGIAADRAEIFGQPIGGGAARSAMLEWVPGGMLTLLDRIGDSRDHDHFAGDVGLLLSLAGYAPSIAASADWPTPDIVAWPGGDGAILVVECTLRELDSKGKLSGLSTRSKELAQRTGRKTIAVIATALELKVIAATDLEKARKESISVLSAESMRGLAELAARGAPEHEVEGWIRGQVPAPPPGPI